jgi:CDP-glycerol glycerophosphotransferase (TagB/SpsB family)/glycosyltransferase involved in cell wall biosynthesis
VAELAGEPVMLSQRMAQLRGLRDRAVLALKYERIARARRAPIDEHSVLYESFSGNGMLCNPEAIFRSLLADEDMHHLRHTWVLASLDDYASTVAEFADDPRVRFVELESPQYYAALATAKYVVNNATFPPQFGKREGQIYLNTWHGTPLKAMGYEVPHGALDTGNIVRNLASADYLLAPNDRTEQMYLDAYRMRNLYRGKIIRAGSPRVDRQFGSDEERTAIKNRLREAGVELDDAQQVVLFAPTWKGNFYAPTNDVRQLRAVLDELSAQIDTRKYRLLLKVHQRVYRYAAADPALRGMLVPDAIPANQVLGVTDVLVTDYSSIFVDFLATGRPILFYAPDIDDYEAARGLDLPVEQWPGPVCRAVDELAGALKQLGSGSADDPACAHAPAYAAARERFTAREDGEAARHVIDIVFRGHAEDHDVAEGFGDSRTPLLIYLGGMRANGISRSALCLLDNLDYDRYDVTVTYQHTRLTSKRKLIDQINPRARHFPRIGGINGGKIGVHGLLKVERRSTQQFRRSTARHAELLRDEWARSYGASEFDYVADFSGYDPLWTQLFGYRSKGVFSIWMHSDMRSESQNPGKSSRHHACLKAVSGLYGTADRLVSVSPALAEVNREKLADVATPERFTYARNTIDYHMILHLGFGADVDGARPAADAEHTGQDVDAGPAAVAADLTDLSGSVNRLVTLHGVDAVGDEVQRRLTIADVLPPAPGVRTFVTAGRLSPEKNHERLIRAFDVVHRRDAATRLVILGSGVLQARLAALVDKLGLTAAVRLAGYRESPYGVLANSDCYVLSSDYEGQPMTLLEASVLGLPVVTTDFDTVRGALPEGHGRIVSPTVDGLAEGMLAFLRGNIPSHPFDYAGYNRDATQEFYRAIGAEGEGSSR